MAETTAAVDAARHLLPDRKAFAADVARQQHPALAFMLVDGKDIRPRVCSTFRPSFAGTDRGVHAPYTTAVRRRGAAVATDPGNVRYLVNNRTENAVARLSNMNATAVFFQSALRQLKSQQLR